MTIDIIKNTIIEKSGMTFSVISEDNPNKIKLKIGENIHDFTITENGTSWSVWADHYCDELGIFNESDIIEELSYIH